MSPLPTLSTTQARETVPYQVARLVAEHVIHIRRDRTAAGQPEASVTPGPVDVAANEIIRDLTYKCRLTVRRGRVVTLNDPPTVIRVEFQVDIPDHGQLHTWDHIVTTPARPYQRVEERR